MAHKFNRCDECGKTFETPIVQQFGKTFCSMDCTKRYDATPSCHHKDEIEQLKTLIESQQCTINQLLWENGELYKKLGISLK